MKYKTLTQLYKAYSVPLGTRTNEDLASALLDHVQLLNAKLSRNYNAIVVLRELNKLPTWSFDNNETRTKKLKEITFNLWYKYIWKSPRTSDIIPEVREAYKFLCVVLQEVEINEYVARLTLEPEVASSNEWSRELHDLLQELRTKK